MFSNRIYHNWYRYPSLFEPEYKGFSGKGEGKWPSSAPGNMKFYDRTKSCYETGGSKANLIAIRYSDILLNYAEVEII